MKKVDVMFLVGDVEDMSFRFDSLDNVEEALDYDDEACFEIEGSELL